MVLHAPRDSGFSLVELMTVLVIVALLALVAWPVYHEAVLKGRRSDAVARLTQVQQAQERWRANQPSYAASLDELRIDASRADSHYELALDEVGGSGYRATATPRADSPQAQDERCTSLSLALVGGAVLYTSTGSGERGAADPCWNH